ncbi:spore cortex-lytic enzyme [Caldibacillus lycopersici]|uniref:Spore cortex-lytic enzyme n=1 Tax=Perspicuibacillus lycopersici TaxID=1325689 RepID=A0AAE3IT70_9BACI|nr:spore cortex-lytic enzyme [Perspicuibacillus lycopersici]MCU9613727.1 spore cortex-lytic enzyme [Perspicuibacillus lycopersici]
MKTKRILKVFLIFACCLLLAQSGESIQKASAFTNQVIQIGAVGDDVIELQSRLQYLGFYNGKIDGVFGWQTYWALRNFQYEFGLKVDGLAGWPTKLKLAKASQYHEGYVKEQINKGNKFTHYGGMDLNKQTAPAKKNNTAQKGTTNQPVKKPAGNTGGAAQNTGNAGTNNQNAGTNAGTNQATANKPTATNVPNGFSQNDIQLMANAVHGESRGESYIGQVAVAAVILNRLDSPSFPDTVSGVIFEPGAFTAVADGQIWLTPNETSKKAVLDAINGWDPTGNAIYYFNPDTATSGWIWSRPQIKQIGKHIFCK